MTGAFALLAACAWAAELSTAPLRAVYPPSHTYTVSLPADWMDAYDWDSIEPGFDARGPDGCCTLGLYYFPSAKSEFKSADHYLARQNSLLAPDERELAPETVRVDGKIAYRIRRAAHLSPPIEKGGSPVEVQQTRVVLPARGGFYLFMLDAAPGSADKGDAALKILLDTFHLVKKRT